MPEPSARPCARRRANIARGCGIRRRADAQNGAPVNTTADAAADPQAWANDYFTSLDRRSFRRLPVPGLRVSLSTTAARIRRQAPASGEHTEDILADVLAPDWDRMSELDAKRVV